MRVAFVVMLLLTTACGGALQNASANATDAAILRLDADRQQLAQVGRAVGQATAEGALGPDTQRRLGTIEGRALSALHVAVEHVEEHAVAMVHDMRIETVAGVRDVRHVVLSGLELEVRQLARAAMDEALGEATRKLVDALREQLVGPPLQADVDALAPHLAAAVDRVALSARAEVDAELSHLRWVISGLVAVVVLLIGLLVRHEWMLKRASTS